MRLRFLAILALSIGTLCCGPVSAQTVRPTVTLSDSTVIEASPYRIGMNLGSLNNYDSGQMLKNIFGESNVGFEPLLIRDIWVQNVAGTTTTFVNPNPYDSLARNQVAGATYMIVESSTAANGCTGTITGNTAGGNSVFTLGTACAAATRSGDQLVMTLYQFPTPGSVWLAHQNNVYGGVSGGGKLATDSTTPYDGKQSVVLDTSAGGSSSAEVAFYADGSPNENYILLNGTYSLSVAAKRVSGSAMATIQAGRLGGPACTLTLSSLTTSWAVYSNPACDFMETPSIVSGSLKLSIVQTGGGVNEFDDASLVKTSHQNAANTTPFRDEVVATLQSICSTTGPKCLVRDWLNQDGETYANWISTQTAATQAFSGIVFSTTGSIPTPRLQDFLALVQVGNGIPYVEVPVTFSTADASSLITYLTSNWVGANKPFPEIYLSFCNECWNQGPIGNTLPYRSGQPYLYSDYALREGDIYHAMRSNPSFSPAIHLGMDLQLGLTSGLSRALPAMATAGGSPDYLEFAPYLQSTISNWQTDTALWASALEEPWGNVADSSSASNYYQGVMAVRAMNLCGAAGKSPCFVTNYEQNNSTVQTCGVNSAACSRGPNMAITQAVEDTMTAGGGQGIIAPLQALLNLQKLGVRAQNLFSLSEDNNGTLIHGITAKLWGVVVDMGGPSSAANAAKFGGSFTPRPQLLGLQIANNAIIGPMFSCPIASQPTYNWAGDAKNGPTHALSNVPYLYSFCFKDAGPNRSVILINTDRVNSYTVSFSGTNPPMGAVTAASFTPTSLNLLNEEPTGVAGVKTATMSNTTAHLGSVTSYTVPPNSVVSLAWVVGTSP